MLMVRLPSGGFGLSKRESSPGRFRPASLLIDSPAVLPYHSLDPPPRVLSIRAAFHTGMPPRREIPEMLWRAASLGWTGWGLTAGLARTGGCCLGCGRHSSIARYFS